ncbi:MAG: glutamate-1-semialdehyde-2,1-aminomutase [Candidatus Riflebacteria bacterium HGW-Riflebacteria-1]|jgi:glutamate-1-semialdehyde 2,1-aminomutase|nr:MAG: glutamate-1-semialdehyde-2,1-aminomutase [Candidatus Riflebacteria bacterium HGW-Riflebacteria-1]
MNAAALKAALQVFPGGVNSPVRAFKSVGGSPLFIKKAFGSRIFDVEGREYIDYVGSWGPMILGHADADVIAAVCHAAASGLSFGAPTEAETELALLVREAFPVIEKMRLVSSGTEATMSAIRLARGFTGRPLLVKFDGAYHGHADSLLVSAGSGVATLAIPGCPGIPDSIAASTLVLPFNDLAALKACFERHAGKIAGLIIEPVCGNIGVVNPSEGYLQNIRKLCSEHGVLLIFDEVMTGFRGCFGGVSRISDVTPDLTCLGKIVGGGMPLAVYGGRADIMAHIAPDGPVYQAGTLSGNPVAVAAGIATLKKIKLQPHFYEHLLARSAKLEAGITAAAAAAGFKVVTNLFGSMFTMFFTDQPVVDYQSAKTADTALFARWFRGMLAEGIYLAPSQFEAAFVSAAHSDADIHQTIVAATHVFKKLAAEK